MSDAEAYGVLSGLVVSQTCCFVMRPTALPEVRFFDGRASYFCSQRALQLSLEFLLPGCLCSQLVVVGGARRKSLAGAFWFGGQPALVFRYKAGCLA